MAGIRTNPPQPQDWQEKVDAYCKLFTTVPVGKKDGLMLAYQKKCGDDINAHHFCSYLAYAPARYQTCEEVVQAISATIRSLDAFDLREISAGNYDSVARGNSSQPMR